MDAEHNPESDPRRNSESNPQSDFTIEPACAHWPGLIARQPSGTVFGQTLERWRAISRRELGLSGDRLIIATGHQTLLWHPGILAKYLVVDAFAKTHDLATANLIVDQHAEGFGDFDIPIRRADGGLAVRKIELCRPKPRKDVPMGRHEAFTPPRVPENLSGALPSVNQGVRRIFDAVYAHREAANAAMQMAMVLEDLMRAWVKPLPIVTSTDLIHTSLARAMMKSMADDPWRCAECYNRAVAGVPQAGIGPLLVRDDYVELPLWRIREDGRRMHAYDSDAAEILEHDPKSKIENRKSKIDLLPRALFMTALVRLCMCDLFIHGTGGAVYDRAMELWMKDWLGIDVGSIAVVTATLRLPLLPTDAELIDLAAAQAAARRWWHDPQRSENSAGGLDPAKREMLEAIQVAPRNSSRRRAAFIKMHEQLDALRQANGEAVHQALERVQKAKRQAADRAIARRRDWAFPLYPDAQINELAQRARREAGMDAVASVKAPD